MGITGITKAITKILIRHLRAPKLAAAIGLSHRFWVVADQGIVSAGSFGTSILLARSLGQNDFGYYALLASIVYVLIVAVQIVVIYPLAGLFNAQDNSISCRGSAVLGAYASALTAGAASAILCWNGRPHLAAAAFLFVFLWLCQDVARRQLILSSRGSECALGDGISYIGQYVLLLVVIALHGTITLQSALLLMSATSFIALLLQYRQLACVPWLPFAVQRQLFHRLRPALGSTLLSTVFGLGTSQGLMWVVTAVDTVGGAASLQAVTGPLGLVHPFLFSISGVTVPTFLDALKVTSAGRAVRQALRHALPLVAVATVICALVALFPTTVLAIFYGRLSPYFHLHEALRLNASVYWLTFLSQYFGSLMTVFTNQRYLAWAQGIGFGIFLLLVPAGAKSGGLPGALMAMAFVMAAKASFSLWWVRSVDSFTMARPTPLQVLNP